MTVPNANVLKYRPLLLSIAKDILGNYKDAEDAVQDTFVKWFERDTTHVKKIKPFLVTTLKNICYNRSHRANKLKAIHEELTETRQSDPYIPLPWGEFDVDRELSYAYEALIRKLNISEKSVYLLREIFNFDYQDIADIVDKKVENCRKILDRAKKRLEENNDRFKAEAHKTKVSFNHFQEACKNGTFHEFVAFLKLEMSGTLA